MRTSGCSEFAVRRVYEDPDPEKAIHPNPQSKCLMKLLRDIHKHQLFPGQHFNLLRGKFISYFDRSLSFESLERGSLPSQSVKGEVTLSLSDWMSDIMINAGQEAYFGKYLGELDAHLAQTFRTFDDLTWQVFYQYPKRLSRTMHEAKRKIIKDFEHYYEAPADQRIDAVWFARSTEIELRNVGFGKHDMAVMMMTVYWS